MKKSIVLTFLVCSLFSYSQKSNELTQNVKDSFLSSLNKKRASKMLGEIYSSTKTDEITQQIFKIKGTVENANILSVLKLEDTWAIYDTYQITQSIPNNISSYYKPEVLLTQRLEERMLEVSCKISTEWWSGKNINTDKPYIIGFYIDILTQNDETIYKIFIISLKNVPMKYKCAESLEH